MGFNSEKRSLTHNESGDLAVDVNNGPLFMRRDLF
jgi:hypothetical protein